MSTTTSSRVQVQQQASDFERPSTFLDGDDSDDLGDINVVFLDEADLEDDDDDDAPKRSPKGQALQKKRWGNLKPKFKRKFEKERAPPRRYYRRVAGPQVQECRHRHCC